MADIVILLPVTCDMSTGTSMGIGYVADGGVDRESMRSWENNIRCR